MNIDKELDEYVDWLQNQAATIGFPMNYPPQTDLNTEAKLRLNALIEDKIREARIDELEWLIDSHDSENSFGYFIEDRLRELQGNKSFDEWKNNNFPDKPKEKL